MHPFPNFKQNISQNLFSTFSFILAITFIFGIVSAQFSSLLAIPVVAQSNTGVVQITLNISSASSSSSNRGGGGSAPKYKICPSPSFNDANNNATFDSTEAELALTTTLVKDNQLLQTIISGNGKCFESVTNGDYVIEQTPPGNTFKSTTRGFRQEIKLAGKDISVAFGYYAPSQVCLPITFQDINGNKQQDFFEPLFGDIYTELKDKNGKIIASINKPNSECFTIPADACTSQNPCAVAQPRCPGAQSTTDPNCKDWQPTCPTQFGNIFAVPGQELVINDKFCYQPTILPRTGGTVATFATGYLMFMIIPVAIVLSRSFFAKQEGEIKPKSGK